MSFSVSAFLTFTCLLFAAIQTPSRPDEKPETPIELVKVCGEKPISPCAKPPRVISAPVVQFSESGRGREFNGVCTLSVHVNSDGSTSHIQVLNSVGKDLDEKAIKAVKAWKFKPAMLDGKPVTVQIAVQVRFHLY